MLTTEEIRTNYAASFPGELDPEWAAEFDAWLAAHDREVAARAVESAANHVHGIHPSPFEQITAYAQKIREGDAVRQWGADA